MIDYIRKRPMILTAILGSICSYAAFYCRYGSLVCGILLIMLFFFSFYKKAKATFLFALVFSFLILLSVILNFKRAEDTTKFEGDYTGSFLICESPIEKPDYMILTAKTVQVGEIPDGTKVMLFCNQLQEACLGDIITADVSLESVEKSEYKKTDYAENIMFTGTSKNIRIIGSNSFYNSIGKIRAYITSTLFNNISYDEAATLNALVSGDNTFFSEEFYSCVKAAGVSHVMVVSGMHLAIIMTAVMYFIKKITGNRLVRAIVTVFVVLFVTAVCGFTMSIIRASLTYLIMTVALVIRRDNTPENSLGTAVSFIILFSPFSVFHVGFQLSVLSTFGILAAAIPIGKRIPKIKLVKFISLNGIADAILVSMFALLFTLPVTILIFGYVSTVSILTNLLLSTAVTFALIVCVLSLVVNLLAPFLAQPLFFASGVITRYINFIIIKFGQLPFSTVDTPKPLVICALLLITIVFEVLLCCKERDNMLKLKIMNKKAVREGGGKIKWR